MGNWIQVLSCYTVTCIGVKTAVLPFDVSDNLTMKMGLSINSAETLNSVT